MPKQLVAQIGYQYFTGAPDDMAALMVISGRLTQVEKQGYQGPYHPTAEQSLFIESAQLAEVDMRGPPAKVDEPVLVPPAAPQTPEDAERPF